MKQTIRGSMRRMVIDKMIVDQGVVPLAELRRVLKVSEPTLKRDIRYMRETLGSPIRFSHSRGGYYYETPEPGETGSSEAGPERKLWYTSEELFALTSMVDILGRLAEEKHSAIAEDLMPLRARVMNLLSLGDVEPSELIRRVRIVNAQKSFREPEAFETIGLALCMRRRVSISYRSQRNREESVREISPLRLVHAKNRWYVDAWDHASDEARTFLIEGIRGALLLEKGARRMGVKAMTEAFDAAYGMFRAKERKTAVIRFDASVAPYVEREVWHAQESKETLADGSVLLRVPYGSSPELLGDVLRWGDRAEVLEPQELRAEMAALAARTAARYVADRVASEGGAS